MRRAFTMIEVLIATGLGLVVAAVAYGGVRAAAQATTTGQRLSLSNALLREGVRRAHDNVDYWTDVDDPFDATHQRLRGSAGGDGLPFTPFAGSLAMDPDPERSRGWDRDNAWKASDPATWWRGQVGESYFTDLRFGRYALFANTGPVPMDVTTDPALGGDYGSVTVKSAWLYHQQRDLFKALQFYGACDYLPANTIYGIHAPYQPTPLNHDGWGGDIDTGTSPDGVPLMLTHYNSLFANADGMQQSVRGLWRLTADSAFALIDPGHDPAADPATLIGRSRRYFLVGFYADMGNGDTSWQAYRARTAVARPLVAPSPAHWPSVAVSTARSLRLRRFIAMSRVAWADPVSGERGQVAFSCMGTTLRGARQQRHPNGGWARWDDAPTATNDPTLDSYGAPQ
ncbi:MAG TPA: type II secretion system protein [Planctomycetota bacterium]|nr:type II secretion system protein [Planctomycetota bacterium]